MMPFVLRVRAQGNEGVDIKEGSANNIVQFNEIYLQLDDNSGGTDAAESEFS